MPSLTGILETSIYVDDLARASRFYEEFFGVTRIEGDARFRAYSVAGRSVLLIFKRGASTQVTQLPFGKMGAHDGSGPPAFSLLHLCGRPARVGKAARRKRSRDREPGLLAARRNQPLFSRSGQPPCGAGHTRSLVDVIRPATLPLSSVARRGNKASGPRQARPTSSPPP